MINNNKNVEKVQWNSEMVAVDSPVTKDYIRMVCFVVYS